MQCEPRRISATDELTQLVVQINEAEWEEENRIIYYDVNSLRSYLEKQDTVFIACFLTSAESPVFAGMASARIEHKPYAMTKWLYVDEVDSCSNYRQKGVGTALMDKLFEIAWENGCEEVWLGAETKNLVANKFYESLEPDEIDAVIGYTFEP